MSMVHKPPRAPLIRDAKLAYGASMVEFERDATRLLNDGYFKHGELVVAERSGNREDQHLNFHYFMLMVKEEWAP